MKLKIALLPGDGIGPEVTAQAVACLQAVEDTFGHQFGDALLCDFAVTSEQIVRKGDAVIRFGGDEFIIVFFSATYETCCRTAEKLREYIGKKYDFVDISYGICPFRNSAEETLQDADEMMYSMKKDRKR